MDFGKLNDPRSLDPSRLKLPLDDPRNSELLARRRQVGRGASPVRVRVGCPVWSCKEWLGTVYAPGTAAKDYLSQYSRQFSNIELNSTHYGIPSVDTVSQWKRSVSSDFRFSPKFPQIISHDRRLRNSAEIAQRFCEAMSLLGENLGTSFLQLPPDFSMAELPWLGAFLRELPRGYSTAVEFRHSSFFVGGRLHPAPWRVLAEAGASALITDVAGRRDVLHSSLASEKVLLRFVGNELHATDFQRIDEWAERLRSWLDLGLKEADLFIHQPDNVLSPQLVTYVVDRLNSVCGAGRSSWTPVRNWTPYEAPLERQLSFF